MDDNRNPLLLPNTNAAPARRVCPKCGSEEFTGRNVQGCIIFTCLAKGCGEKFGGSLAQTPIDPMKPLPPESYVPPVRFERGRDGKTIEVDRRVDTRPEYRKGAPVPEGDE